MNLGCPSFNLTLPLERDESIAAQQVRPKRAA